jgi:SAM-dependent methyltransferase
MVLKHVSPLAVDTEYTVCNLCGADDARELYRAADYRFQVDRTEWPVVQCRRCSLAYLNPRPAPAAIGRYYPRGFFEGRELEHAVTRYKHQADYLSDISPGRLLDIGCANGDWMYLMTCLGWRVSGIERSPNSSNPHGLDIRRGDFPDSCDYQDNYFDVVTAWAVFEHLHDPMAAFTRVGGLLRSGGYFILLVTNIKSIFSRYSYQEDIPRHLYFFSERTLARYADSAGLYLHQVDHSTKLYGGAGRGALRLRVFSRLGWSRREYFRFIRLPRPERMRRCPAMAALGMLLGGIEHLVLSDWLVCRLRLNGHIVAVMRKP